MEPVRTLSNKPIAIPINGAEARALEVAADRLLNGRELAKHRRKRIAEQLRRLNARFKIRDESYRG